MPSLESHQSNAVEFLAAFNAVPGDNRAPRVVMLYLSALHIVEMMAAKDGRHSDNHEIRNTWTKRAHPKLWKLYQPLYSAGRRARYNPDQLDYDAAAVIEHLYKRQYRGLALAVNEKLGEKCTLVDRLGIEPARTPRPTKSTQ